MLFGSTKLTKQTITRLAVPVLVQFIDNNINFKLYFGFQQIGRFINIPKGLLPFWVGK